MSSAHDSKEEALRVGKDVANQYAHISDMYSIIEERADELKDAETNASVSAEVALEAQENAEASANSAIAAKIEACALNQSIKDGINTLEIVEDLFFVLPGETVEKEVLTISNPQIIETETDHYCRLNTTLKAYKKYRIVLDHYDEGIYYMALAAGEYDNWVTGFFKTGFDPDKQFMYCDITTGSDFPEDKEVFVVFIAKSQEEYVFESLKIIDITPRPSPNTISPLVDNLYVMGATLEEIGNKVFDYFYRNPSPSWTFADYCFDQCQGYYFNADIEIEEGKEYTFKVSEKSGNLSLIQSANIEIDTGGVDYIYGGDLEQNEDGYWEVTFTADRSYSGNVQIGVITAEDTKLDFGAVTLKSVTSIIDTIGDIDTALDGIIAIQENLINGGSA